MPPQNLKRLRTKLLRWYDRNRRRLPWRRTGDPYAIWIAETMLQQTQVKTVIPYYRRFLRAFPTLAALDRAHLEKVLALWSGLGYYRRAENLKKSAKKIMREHGGELPRQYGALRALPGIGPYTAGAVMSIAFHRPYPALDGNGRRVLSRLFAVNAEKRLGEIAGRLVQGPRPGDFNQALMDLGSAVCFPREPRCPACPVAGDCAWHEAPLFRRRRFAPTKPKMKKIVWPLALVENNGRILLRRRPPGSLLSGLWEVPGGERKNGEAATAALRRHLSGSGKSARPGTMIGAIRHSITNRRIRAPLYLCAGPKTKTLPSGWRWVKPSSLGRYPLSSLSLKALKLAEIT
jgi:A/G-specific adenine glycosylase